MPIETAIWRLDGGLRRVTMSPLDVENRLEHALTVDLEILGLDLLLIGRQIPTAYGKRIDVVAIRARGRVHSSRGKGRGARAA